jgi:hypothetical protein
MAKIPLRMPMLPKETPTPIPTFRLVLSLVALSPVEVVVDGEGGEEVEGVLAVDGLVGVGVTDRIDDRPLVIKSLL